MAGQPGRVPESPSTAETILPRRRHAALLPLLQAQRVNYVYVGRMEAEKYGPDVRDRFEGPLETVYRSGDVAIYGCPSR